MKTFRKMLIGLLVAVAVLVPLSIAAAVPGHTAQRAVSRIATQPTPTPTQSNGQCHALGC